MKWKCFPIFSQIQVEKFKTKNWNFKNTRLFFYFQMRSTDERTEKDNKKLKLNNFSFYFSNYTQTTTSQPDLKFSYLFGSSSCGKCKRLIRSINLIDFNYLQNKFSRDPLRLTVLKSFDIFAYLCKQEPRAFIISKSNLTFKPQQSLFCFNNYLISNIYYWKLWTLNFLNIPKYWLQKSSKSWTENISIRKLQNSHFSQHE